jgi:uncharacterized membrane protein/uncharacterized Zn finger protein (UPF0148 family)
MLRVFCPTCKTPFDVDNGLIGQKGLCPTCGAKFIISKTSAEPIKERAATTQPIVDSEQTPATTKAAKATVSEKPKGLGLALLLAAGTAAAYWALASGKVAESRWLSFAGELHPMIIHFPAALIPTLAAVQVFGGNSEGQTRVTRVLLWLNFLACAVGILAGFASGLDRGESESLRIHTILGLATAAVSFFMLVFHTLNIRPLYLMNLALSLAAVFGAGHFGANMSHGDISKKLPWVEVPKAASTDKPVETQATAPTPTTTSAVTLLSSVVQPILNARCVGCHGAEKAKGDLRLDSYADMMKAGESGKPSFLAGNAAQSESLVRSQLPLEDEDHMPPSKKPQCTPEELEVLTWWVQDGASATKGLEDLGVPGGMKAKMLAVVAALPK